MLVLILHLLVTPALAQPKPQDCNAKTPALCNQLASWYRGKEDKQKTYDYSLMGCKLNEPYCCSSLYYEAQGIGPKEMAATKDLLIKKCKENDAFCGDVAQVYYEEKNFEKGLEIDRRYFMNYSKGTYPFMAYQHGHKKEGFAATLTQCQQDKDRCIFFVRYMPDHPQYSVLLRNAEDDCKLSAGSQGGATNCAILGAYYYKNYNHKKSLEIWDSECRLHVQSSCELIIGSDADVKTRSAAFQNYCFEGGQGRLGSDNESCSAPNPQIPETLRQKSIQLLESYLREQKVLKKN